MYISIRLDIFQVFVLTMMHQQITVQLDMHVWLPKGDIEKKLYCSLDKRQLQLLGEI